ncbi:MAG: MopE-related protein [Proteobacteria bacterium]|nr:MopE-related protein [Pseudomonadota bacterium]
MKPEKAFWKSPFRSSFIRKSLLMGHSFAADRNILPSSGFLFIARSVRRVFGGLGCLFLIYVFFSSHLFAESLASGPVQTKLVEAGSELVQAGSDFNMNVKDVMLNSSSICSCNPLYSEDGSHYVSITNSPSSLGSVWIYSIHFKPAYYRIWFYDPYSELSDHLLEPGEGGSFLRWYSPGYGNYYLPFFIPTVQATGGSATLEFVIKTKYHDSNGEEKWDEFNFSLSLADGEVFGNYHCYTDNYVFYADGCGSNTYDYDCDGWSPCEGDCNDYNSSAHPGAAEQCDGIDNNCDGIIDLVNCYDGPSGTENTGICHGGTKNVCREYDPCEGEQTPLPELCNNVDDNCNGIVDDINITEACNGVDDNCNNFIDEGCNDTDDQQDQNIKDCGIGQGEDPVNIVTGNYYTHPLQDFFIKSDLMDINFSRFYNSQKIYDGPIGFGWTYSYNIFLINLPDESIKVLLGGGKGLYFTPDGQGGYFPPRGLNYKLNRIQTEWSLINPDGQIYFFNDLGKLNKITNPAGGILEFDYNSESQISKIRSGNIAVQLSYLNGKISEIVGPDDEVLVTYQYDEANNLIHVAYPDNSFINYFYDDYYGDIHNLTGISEEDSSGSILSYQSIGYDSLDRVESLRRGWEILRFNYYPESQYTQIQAYVQDVGGKEPYKVHYNEYGVSTWIEGDCGCGGSSASEWDSSENNLNRTKFTDKNGNETHYQDYDDRGNPGKIIDALGHETFSAYHPVLNTPLYIIKDSVLGLSGTKKITIYDYDDPSSAVDPYPTDNPTDFNQTPTNYLHKMIEKGFTYNSSGQIDHYTYVTRYFYESSETNLQSNNIVLSDLNGDIWLIPYLLDGNFGSKLWVANLGIPIPYPMVADYNQDGNFDIALTGTSEVYLLQNDGNLNFTTKIIASGFSMSNDYYWGATGAAGDFGDFINDPNHLPDIAIKTSAFGPQIVILENLGVINGEIQFLEKGFFSPPNPSYVPTQLKSGYFNNDEYLDLVLGYYGGFFCVMFGDGAGNFPTYSCAGIPGCPAFGGYHEIVAVIAGDFNGDGNTDVLAGQTHDNDAGQSYLFLGDGNGNFNLIGLSCADPWSYEYGYDTNPYSEGSSGDYGIGYGATMDFNGDGALDIVASASYYGIEYFPGVGDGKFGPLTYVDPAEGRVDVASNASMGTGVKRLVSIDGPRTDVADVTSFAYYSDSPDQGYNRGRLKTVADPTGGITRYDDYKLFGNPTKITDPNGRVTLNGYDFRGRLISSTQKEAGPSGEDDLVTQYALDGLGSIKRVTQPNGETIDYQYEDDTHHLLGIAHGTQWVEYDYDWFGNQILDGINDRDFDENNRLFRIYNNDWGTYTQFAYDPNGNRTSVTDDNGNANTYEYDALNRLVQVSGVPASQPSSVLAFYQYDSHDNLISVTSYRAPDSSLLTNYSYDDMGRLVQINSPDSGLARFQYDEAGNLIAKFDANSQETTYSYDVLNRLVELSSLPASQPSSVDVTYAYDQGVNGLGRLSTVTDESGSSSYAYDQRGNLAHENKTLGSLPFALSYSYDANGNVSSITYPSGRVVNYQYDSGLVSGVNATLNGSSTTLASNFTYDGNLLSGKATHFVYGNGLEYVMWFNARYNPWFFVVGAFAGEELAQVTAARFYSYDPVDNIIGFDQYDSFEDLNQGNTAQTDQFGYDPLNRLISADGTYLGDLDFGYDLAGNRISEVDDGKNYDYSYYDGTNRLREVLDPPANSGGSPGSSGSSGLHKNVGQGFSPAFSPSFPSFKNTPSPHPGRHSRGSGNPGVYPSPLRGEGRGEGERVPTDWQRIVGVVPSVPDNFEDLDENGWTDIHDRVDGFCHKWHHKIPEDILIQLKYLKMLIEIKLYALKLSSPSFKSGSSNVGEPLCRLPSGRFYKPEHGKPCPPPPPPPQVTAGEFVGKVPIHRIG